MADYKVRVDEVPTPEEMLAAIRRAHRIYHTAVKGETPWVNVHRADLAALLVMASLWLEQGKPVV